MTYEEFRRRYQYEPGKLQSPENDEAFGHLGEGGFGAVYKGWDSTENQWVAIKIAPVRTGPRDLSLKREVELANQLPRHANIARYERCERITIESGVIDVAVLKYYKAGNLAELLQNQSLNQTGKDDIIVGILTGLAHLHHHHMAHRDLKPQNILIAMTPYGKYVPLITDFGLSKLVQEEDLTASSVAFLNSTIAGSIYYMAPEQLTNNRMRFNVDLWAFGVILYELMTGQKPFQGDSGMGSETERYQIIQRINTVEIPSQFSTIPEPYQTMIRQCLVRDVDQRVQTAGALLRIFSPPDPMPLPPPPVELPAYDEQRSFSGGHAAVRIGSRWGLINTAGKLVVPVEYDSVSDVQGQQALVRRQGQASRIEVSGNGFHFVSPHEPASRPAPLPMPPPPVPLPGPAPFLKDAYFPDPQPVPTLPVALRQAYTVVAVAIGLILFGMLLLSLASNGVFDSTSRDIAQAGVLMIGAGSLMLFGVLVTAVWKTFEKAGEPGWAAIVPIYNHLTLLRIVGKPWWWIFLMLIPYVNLVFLIWVCNLLSKRFGKSEGFTLGLVFLPFIFYPKLAWGNARSTLRNNKY